MISQLLSRLRLLFEPPECAVDGCEQAAVMDVGAKSPGFCEEHGVKAAAGAIKTQLDLNEGEDDG